MVEEPVPRRIAAVRDELDNAAMDYVLAKDWYEEARVKFESARERLASIRKLAQGILTTLDLSAWQREHPDVQYAATPIADAALNVLTMNAYVKAWEVADANEKGQSIAYKPFMSLADIVKELEAGGFEFRTTSASREANAALLNLAGIEKPYDGYFQIENTKDILAMYLPTPPGKQE